MKMLTVLVLMLMVPAAIADSHTEASATLNASAGVTPDSVFYGLDTAMENLQRAMARSPEARAELHVSLAEEKIAEMEAMADAENEAALERSRGKYNMYAREARSSAEDADAETRADVDARLAVHTEVLTGLLERFESENSPAVAGIRTALETSQKVGQVESGAQANASANAGGVNANVGAEVNVG